MSFVGERLPKGWELTSGDKALNGKSVKLQNNCEIQTNFSISEEILKQKFEIRHFPFMPIFRKRFV